MKKENLLKRSEAFEMEAKTSGDIIGYPRGAIQKDIAKAGKAIITALCDIDNLTPKIAEYALKMATEVLDIETKKDTIS